eukprot:168558_1
MSVRTCVLCKALANKRCSGCKQVYYCSKQCQSNHWKQHKKECKGKKNMIPTSIPVESVGLGLAQLYVSFVLPIVPWQEIFPLLFIGSYAITGKEIQYLFVYAIMRLCVQKAFDIYIIGTQIIASCAIPIALNYKSQQPCSNDSITLFR